VHDEYPVIAVAVCAAIQVALQSGQIALKPKLKGVHFRHGALSLAERKPATPNIS